MDHSSASQINMYLRCSAQYAFRYLDGLKCPPGSALTLGSSFHSAVGGNYAQKVESKVDLPVADVCDLFSTQWEAAKHETAFYPDEDPGEIKDSGIMLLREYQTVLAPNVQPAFAESKFELSFKNIEEKFVGYVDLVDEHGIIRETKTASKNPGLGVLPDHKLQVISYATGYRVTHKEPERNVFVDYCIKKKKPEITSYSVKVYDTDIDYFLGMVMLVLDGIKKGVAIPNRASNLCSYRWCGYAALCEKKYGGIVRKGKVD